MQESPTLRADGSILQVPGYDTNTGLLYTPSAIFPLIPDTPSEKQAEKAKLEIDELLHEFSFADAVDGAVAVAMLMTGVRRRVQRTAPCRALFVL